MKKLGLIILAAAILICLAACGDSVLEPPDDYGNTVGADAIDLFADGYKIVYDVSDSNAISIMSAMVGKINETAGKLSSLNSGNPETECEIQFGLKSGRADAERVYAEISSYADSKYSAYTIRVVGKKIVISASDTSALKVAADRFAEMVSHAGAISPEYDETAIFELNAYQHGELKPVYADEFGADCTVTSITLGGKQVGVVDGRRDYFRASEGKVEFPTIEVETKYPTSDVKISKLADRYEIKVTSADKSKEEIYNMTFIETAPLDKYDLNTWVIPYWEGCITYHESVMFVGDEGAPLLYNPEHILSVRSSDLKTEYVEGVDYEVRDGKLYRLEGSKMPHFTWDEFYPASKETSVTGNAFAGSSKPFVFFTEGTYFHENQVFVTYTHQPNAGLFTPAASTKLASFENKLNRGESVNLVFYGDSITAGGNASGRNGGVAPYTPIWAEIVRDALVAKYPSAKINYTNTAVGGKETNWAIEELETRVNAYKPDLLVLAFGMNDGGKTTEQFIANIKTIIDRVLAANPDCEIAVIGTMLPHSETTYYKNQYLQEAALYELAKGYKNVDVIPMTSVHSALLTSKRYFDMTGNNVNHANDFLIRAYAQTILKVIVGE